MTCWPRRAEGLGNRSISIGDVHVHARATNLSGIDDAVKNSLKSVVNGANTGLE